MGYQNFLLGYLSRILSVYFLKKIVLKKCLKIRLSDFFVDTFGIIRTFNKVISWTICRVIRILYGVFKFLIGLWVEKFIELTEIFIELSVRKLLGLSELLKRLSVETFDGIFRNFQYFIKLSWLLKGLSEHLISLWEFWIIYWWGYQNFSYGFHLKSSGVIGWNIFRVIRIFYEVIRAFQRGYQL